MSNINITSCKQCKVKEGDIPCDCQTSVCYYDWYLKLDTLSPEDLQLTFAEYSDKYKVKEPVAP